MTNSSDLERAPGARSIGEEFSGGPSIVHALERCEDTEPSQKWCTYWEPETDGRQAPRQNFITHISFALRDLASPGRWVLGSAASFPHMAAEAGYGLERPARQGGENGDGGEYACPFFFESIFFVRVQ